MYHLQMLLPETLTAPKKPAVPDTVAVLNILTAPPTDNVPPIVALPTRTESPLIQTSSLKSTLSPNVLFVNVSVVDVPTNVAATCW